MSVNKNKGVPFLSWVFALAIFASVGAWASGEYKNAPKKYSVSMELNDWDKYSRAINDSRVLLRQSNVRLDLVYGLDSVLTNFQIAMASQINAVLVADQKADSIQKATEIKKPKN